MADNQEDDEWRFRYRTRALVASFNRNVGAAPGSPTDDELRGLEQACTDSIRLLRDHKTVVVRAETADPVSMIDYPGIKNEIDSAITQVLGIKGEWRELGLLRSKAKTPTGDGQQKLDALLELHRSGVLTQEEFARAKARIG